MEKIEYRVRPVARYVVTRYASNESKSGVETYGEFENKTQAARVASALAATELGSVLLKEQLTAISQATLANIDTSEWMARGKVLRVFDSNGSGQLIPVEFIPMENETRFKLKNSPYGQIWAEHHFQ